MRISIGSVGRHLMLGIICPWFLEILFSLQHVYTAQSIQAFLNIQNSQELMEIASGGATWAKKLKNGTWNRARYWLATEWYFHRMACGYVPLAQGVMRRKSATEQKKKNPTIQDMALLFLAVKQKYADVTAALNHGGVTDFLRLPLAISPCTSTTFKWLDTTAFSTMRGQVTAVSSLKL